MRRVKSAARCISRRDSRVPVDARRTELTRRDGSAETDRAVAGDDRPRAAETGGGAAQPGIRESERRVCEVRDRWSGRPTARKRAPTRGRGGRRMMVPRNMWLRFAADIMEPVARGVKAAHPRDVGGKNNPLDDERRAGSSSRRLDDERIGLLTHFARSRTTSHRRDEISRTMFAPEQRGSAPRVGEQRGMTLPHAAPRHFRSLTSPRARCSHAGMAAERGERRFTRPDVSRLSS